MAFIENFLVPLFTLFFILLIFGLIILGFYFLIMKYFHKQVFGFQMWFKYKLLKKGHNPKVVAWALEMIEDEVDEQDLKKEYYSLNMFQLGTFSEAEYIYNQIKRMGR